MKSKAAWLTLAALSLSACAHHAGIPSANNGAIIRVMATVDSANVTASYQFYADPSCSTGSGHHRQARFSANSPSAKDVPVVSGARIHVLSERTTSGVGRLAQGSLVSRSSSCRNLVSFVPEPGRTYRIEQSGTDTGCRAEVVEAESHLPPPTLEVLPVPDSCAK